MKNSGFTIIELIVVISVIAILAVIGIAAFVNYGRVQALETAASQIVSYLNLAKSRSISQVKPQSCVNQTLNGYKVVLTFSSQNYELDVVCSGFSYKIEGKTLPRNITFDAVNTTSTSFFFPVIVSGVEGAGRIVIQGYEKSKTITVDSVGGIK